MKTTSMMAMALIFASFFFSDTARAQPLSASVIEQLQTLPLAQREALARRYGVSLDQLSNQRTSATRLAQPGQPLEVYESLDQQLARELQVQNQPFFRADDRANDDEDVTRRFGLELFNQEVSTFSPTDDSPISDDYVLGVGDELIIYLFGKETAEYVLQVNRDGLVTVPGLGNIVLAGTTLRDAKLLISNRVESQMIGVESTVSLGRLRAISIFMAGEVSTPGAYSVSAMTTVTQALFQAGGVSEIGSLRNIQVRRSGQVIGVFDVYDLLMRGDASDDIRLQSGDIVFVPPYSAIVEVTGAVKRPRVYEIEGNETLRELLDMAGGITRDAHERLASIRRLGPDTGVPEVLNVDLMDPQHLAEVVKAGDVLLVRERGDALQNSVMVRGAVYRPGHYGWVPGMRISDLIQNPERDLILSVDMDYALVVRIKNVRQDIEVLQFNLGQVLSEPKSKGDLELQPRDQVLIFRLPQVEVDVETGDDEFSVARHQGDRGFATNLDPRFPGNLSNELLDRSSQISANVARRNDQNMLIESKEDRASREKKEAENAASRAELLAPVIEKLRLQARQQEPAQVVSISGAIRAPGDYPLVSNANLAQLISAAGGLKDNAFLKAAELRRLSLGPDGEIIANYQMVDLEQALDASQSATLASRDHLTVREIPDWNPTESVTIAGEVRFPGEYRLQKGETLVDLIERAGGLTPDAFVEGAMLKRKSIAALERARAKELAASIRQSVASSLLTEEVQTVALSELDLITRELESFQGQGRLLIDLPAALSGDRLADIQLFDGDSLDIPQVSSNITVVGEVKRQGTHSFNSTMSVKDYLAMSAGLTERADSEAIYVVRANGYVDTVERSLWKFGRQSVSLRPGDTIVVPVDGRYKESLVAWRDITQIIYQGAVSLAAVLAL
jgi:polysaccharide biosynthesis/export protein